jgi:hypothetical protein
MKRVLCYTVLGAALASCAYDPPLAQVSFHVAFAGVDRDAAQPFTVTTPQGWSVTLTAAQVSIGPIYFHNGQPGFGTDEDDGRVVAQVLAQFTVDALNPSVGTIEHAGTGNNEPARSGEVRLVEANDGPIADTAGAGMAVAHIAGVAVRGAVVIRFDGSLELPMGATASGYESWLQHRVSHIPTTFTPDEGGTLTLRVDPTHWLDNVTFDAAGGTAPDFSSRSTATQLLGQVGSSTRVFVFTWSPPSHG